MQTQGLEVFLTVARCRSFTAAARRLGYTQSAVSRQIAVLEKDLDAELFDRRARGVELTEQGRTLLPHAEALLGRLTAAHRDLDALRGIGGGRLRVGAFPTAVAALVPRALAAFRTAYPKANLSLVEGLTPHLLQQVHAGDADVAVVSAPPDRPIEAPGLELHHLLDEQLLVAVPLGHRLAARGTLGEHGALTQGEAASGTIRLAELADESFIAGSATAEESLLRATLPSGFRPRIDIVAAEWTGKLGCVAAGLGVALVPALAMRATPADLVLLRLHPDDASVRQIFAATARKPTPAVAHMLGLLRAAAAPLSHPELPS